MPKHNLTYAEIKVFTHATEDEEKVKSAILAILPDKIAEKTVFSPNKMSGYHGNLIIELSNSVSNRKDAYCILLEILSKFSTQDETLVKNEFTKYFDEKNRFYLRLNKQQAFSKKIVLSSDDSISFSFRLNFHPKSFEELVSTLNI